MGGQHLRKNMGWEVGGGSSESEPVSDLGIRDVKSSGMQP